MKKLAKTKFKRIKKKRNKAKNKRKFPKIFTYKTDNNPNLENKIRENPDNKIKEFFPHFPQNEFNFENCPEFQLGENISNDANNIQDFHFPLDFDLNMNDPNIQDDIIF